MKQVNKYDRACPSQNIWFTSDTHYNHANIVRGISNWPHGHGTRDYNTLDEHNEHLVQSINANVGQDDILYHLGDWSFGGLDKVFEFASRLVCKNVHLILGNHDHHIENNKGGAKGIFKSVQHYLNKTIGGQNMVLCHYAMRTWNHGHKDTIMLFGHSHNTLPDYCALPLFGIVNLPSGNKMSTKTVPIYRTMDVGMDAHPEFRPYHIDEILSIMKKRIPLGVDHHNKETT